MYGNFGTRATRRRFLGSMFAAAGLTAAGALLGACAPAEAPTPTAAPKPAAPAEAKPTTPAEAAPTPTAAAPAPTKAPVAPAPAPTPTMAPAPAAKAKAQLTVWAPKHFLPAQNDYITESMKIAAQKGNFEVEVQMFAWGELNQKFAAAIEAKTLPDAALGVDVARYRAMNLLVDVSDLFKEVGESGGGWLDVAISGVTFKGKQWGLQFHLEPQVIYYRKDIFEKAGLKVPLKDLNEFVEAAKAVTDPAKNMWGFGQAYSDCPDGNNAFMMFMWAFGGMLQNKNNELVVNSPETLQGLTYYAELYTKHKVVPTGATGWDDTGNNKAYLSGQAAMILNTGSVIYTMRTDNKEMLANTVLGPLPAGPAGPQAFTGGSSVGIFQSSKYQDQCRQVIRTILSPERYPGNLKSAGGMFFPTLKKYESDPFFVEDRWNKEIAGTGQYAKQGHYAGDPQPWIGELTLQWLWSKMTTKVVIGGATPKAALDEFTQKCKEIQKKYEGL